MITIERCTAKKLACFSELDVGFSEGLNLVIGKNNSGKSKLLDALSFSGPMEPSFGCLANDREISLTVRVRLADVLDLSNVPSGFGFGGQLFFPVEATDEAGSITFDDLASRTGIYELSERNAAQLEEKGCVVVLHSRNVVASVSSRGMLHVADYSKQLLRSRVFCYKPRPDLVTSVAWSHQSELSPMGDNLPQVLDLLYRDRSRFDDYQGKVREILPEIKVIKVDSLPNNQIEVRVEFNGSPHPVPLSKCGFGTSVVLCVVYLCLLHKRRIILLDEIQSYLHPGALRKLLVVLENSPHQVFVASHSPIALSGTDSRTILVRCENGKSSAITFSPEERQVFNSVLTEIGARLSDVFGADGVLWVEGETEEDAFPLIIRKLLLNKYPGLLVRSFGRTGTLV